MLACAGGGAGATSGGGGACARSSGAWSSNGAGGTVAGGVGAGEAAASGGVGALTAGGAGDGTGCISGSGVAAIACTGGLGACSGVGAVAAGGGGVACARAGAGAGGVASGEIAVVAWVGAGSTWSVRATVGGGGRRAWWATPSSSRRTAPCRSTAASSASGRTRLACPDRGSRTGPLATVRRATGAGGSRSAVVGRTGAGVLAQLGTGARGESYPAEAGLVRLNSQHAFVLAESAGERGAGHHAAVPAQDWPSTLLTTLASGIPRTLIPQSALRAAPRPYDGERTLALCAEMPHSAKRCLCMITAPSMAA